MTVINELFVSALSDASFHWSLVCECVCRFASLLLRLRLTIPDAKLSTFSLTQPSSKGASFLLDPLCQGTFEVNLKYLTENKTNQH